jgi:tetratricopeptide (TPR) repeat protein
MIGKVCWPIAVAGPRLGRATIWLGAGSAKHTEDWASTRSSSKPAERCYALTLMMPGPGLSSPTHTTALGDVRRPSKPNGSRCIEPDNFDGWRWLGIVYKDLRRFPEAIEAYREALRLEPDDYLAWYDLGNAYEKLSRYPEAIEAYREYLSIDSDDAEAWYNLGVAYANSGNRTAALEALKELRRYDPQEAEKLFNHIMKR